MINSASSLKYCKATLTKTGKLQSDLLCQIVRLKKDMSYWTFFCFSAAFIRNVLKECKLVEYNFFKKTGTCNLHCCRWYKFTVKALLYNTLLLYIWQRQQHRMQCCVPLQNDYACSNVSFSFLYSASVRITLSTTRAQRPPSKQQAYRHYPGTKLLPTPVLRNTKKSRLQRLCNFSTPCVRSIYMMIRSRPSTCFITYERPSIKCGSRSALQHRTWLVDQLLVRIGSM